MADKKISELSSAAALTGSEPIPIVQGGATVQTTAQDIANLAGGSQIAFTKTKAQIDALIAANDLVAGACTRLQACILRYMMTALRQVLLYICEPFPAAS